MEYANSFFVSNVSAGVTTKSFDESFICPQFSLRSEYEKETDFDQNDEEAESLDDIARSDANYLFVGRKEIGKTTLLHFLAKKCIVNFNAQKSVPFVLNCAMTDFAGKQVVHRALHNFVNEFCDENDSFSKQDIEKLLSAGLCTIMFDSYDETDESARTKINEFITQYPKNKFVFSIKEVVGARALRDTPFSPACEFKKLYMCSLTKGQIRAIASTCLYADACVDNSSLVDKIMLCFKKTTLPKTPFVLSLMLSLCDNTDFSPINEAVVMEQFMETLLGKNLPLEVNSSTYDFRNKEDFLIHLASCMNSNNKFYFHI